MSALDAHEEKRGSFTFDKDGSEEQTADEISERNYCPESALVGRDDILSGRTDRRSSSVASSREEWRACTKPSGISREMISTAGHFLTQLASTDHHITRQQLMSPKHNPEGEARMSKVPLLLTE